MAAVTYHQGIPLLEAAQAPSSLAAHVKYIHVLPSFAFLLKAWIFTESAENMPKNLVIVESPAKAKTIEGYLGADYQVASCNGHIRDLPKNGRAVDVAHGAGTVAAIPLQLHPLRWILAHLVFVKYLDLL